MQVLVKLTENSLYGVHIREDSSEFFKCKSEQWMQSEYDDNVLLYWKLANGTDIVKFKTHEKYLKT